MNDERPSDHTASGRPNGSANVSEPSDREQADLETQLGGDGKLDESGAVARGDTSAPTVLEPGAVFGRYVVLAALGAGAMGVVHAAYDPTLDRKVAVKLLGQTSDTGDRQREALVLAKINHPNVVAVYDVGSERGWTWIAMELVDGVTLRERMAAGPIPWRVLVELMIDVARGLHAAHAAGLVHRDVKPDNVMIGSDGRVRVMDFGLAHARVDAVRNARAGTPAYMAPEQHAGQPCDPRTDVFGWSVTFYEALWGHRPFAGDGLGELVGAIATGRIRDIPPDIAAPRWLREAILRGLAADPDRRWPSLDAVIGELSRGIARPRRRKLVVGGAGVLALLTVPAVLAERDERERQRACERDAHAIDGVWNAEARAAITTTLGTTEVAGSASAAAQTSVWFDAAAQTWATVYRETCLAAALQGEPPPAEVYECLDGRKSAIGHAVTVLSDPSLGHFDYAPSFVVDMLEVDSCRSAGNFASMDPPDDAAVRARLDGVRLEMAQSAALLERGEMDRAIAVAEGAHAHAVEIGWSPLVHETAALVGRVLERGPDPAAAPRWIERAALGALAEVDGELSIRLAISMSRVEAESRGDFEASHSWLRIAERRIERLGLGETLHGAMFATVEAGLARAERRHADALAADERALALRVRLLGADHPQVALTWNNLAVDHGALRDDEAGLDAAIRGYEIRARAFGDGHPEVLLSATNVAVMHSRLGASDLGRDLLEDALRPAIRTIGFQHPLVAVAFFNLAVIAHRDEDAVASEVFARLTVDLLSRHHEPDTSQFATALTNLAGISLRNGDCVDAIYAGERAVAGWERVKSPRPVDAAAALGHLGNSEWLCRRSPRGLGMLERAAVMVPSDAAIALASARARLGAALVDVDPLRATALMRLVAERAPPGEEKTFAERWLAGDRRP